MLQVQAGSVVTSATPFPRCATEERSHNRQKFASVLHSHSICLERVNFIHATTASAGSLHDAHTGNSLIGTYRECHALEDSPLAFNSVREYSTVSWTMTMAALCDQGLFDDALLLFHDMHRHGLEPNHVTFITVLQACSGKQALIEGNSVHAIVLDCGLQGNILVATSLINMYSRSGDIQAARVVFEQTYPRDLFIWNSMIAGYSELGLKEQVFELLTAMQQEGFEPNQVTHIHVLATCNNAEDLEDGKFAHAGVLKSGLDTYVRVGTALVNMYGKCGTPHLARAAFNTINNHDIISWTTMITAYSGHGQGHEAFKLFKDYDRIFQPTKVTIVSVLSACANLDQGQTIHGYAVEHDFESDVIVGTALINMYGRCCSLENAWVVFSKTQLRDIICWNSAITLCGQHGQMDQALFLFQEMQQSGMEPNALTFNALLCACACPGGLFNGKVIHECIKAKDFQSNTIVANALINMYSKCGAWENACVVFEELPVRNLSSWNSIIAGCCQHGHAKDALQYFEAMQREGIEPDDVTYLCLLTACSHAGLVEESLQCFLLMLGAGKLKPSLEHLTSVVSLLGRCGHLEDAEKLILKTSFQHDSAIWLTLLGACSTHKDIVRGEHIAWIILNLEPRNETAYTLLANMYIVTGRSDDWKKLHEVRQVHVTGH